MQCDVLSESTLEEFYEKAILPQFGVEGDISWDEHLVIGPDNVAHVFMCNKKRMALVFDDFPATDATSLNLEFPLDTVARISLDLGGVDVAVDNNISSDSDKYILRFGPSALPFKYIHNITGYFQLFSISSLDCTR